MVCPQCGNDLSGGDGRTLTAILCSVCGSSIRLDNSATATWVPEIGLGAAAESPDSLAVASGAPKGRIGKFEVIRQVGAGGFGAVFMARDPGLNRIVAIKIPRLAPVAELSQRRHFLDEARHLAQLRHPGIVPVYEAGEAEGVPFLVTEFLEGASLAERLRQRRPAVREAAELCARVAEALHYAHEAGIVHRDVKPGNIMLDAAGLPYVTDFGLAKEDQGEITVSLSGEVLGTPAYMSPEQAAGEARNVDRRSDVYSLGVVLYEMLTGERPFRGNNQMILYQVLHEEPRPPRALNHRIAHDLEVICLKAMSREPRHRYATAQEFADDLRRYLRSEPVHARPAGPGARLWLWARRADRIREASIITVAMCLMLALWEFQGLILMLVGVLEVPNAVNAAGAMTTGMVLFSFMAGLGWIAGSRTLMALWGGTVAAVLLLLFSIGCLAGAIRIEGLAEKAVRVPVFSFFSIAAGFTLAAHIVSLAAYYANRSAMRWAKTNWPKDSAGDGG